jgi:hypothetical protein
MRPGGYGKKGGRGRSERRKGSVRRRSPLIGHRIKEVARGAAIVEAAGAATATMTGAVTRKVRSHASVTNH